MVKVELAEHPFCPILRNAELFYHPCWLDGLSADTLLESLQQDIEWEQSSIWMYGKEVNIPRLNAWYGDPGCTYTYSGKSFVPHTWSKPLLGLKSRLEMFCNRRYNSVLLNYYRDGQDSVAWHSDDEPELGASPIIASISLGASRTFQMRHRQEKDLRYSLLLEHGSLLIMSGETQRYWQHQIPKTRKPIEKRINLTFRSIVGSVVT